MSWPFVASMAAEVIAPGESGKVHAGRDVFTHESNGVWSWQGATQFLLFRHFLTGQDIAPQAMWLRKQRMYVPRVLGMVGWSAYQFSPNRPEYFEKLLAFVRLLGAYGLRCEFTVFADAQLIMPDPVKQREHLKKVMQVIGSEPNVFIEVANEPGINGVAPFDLIAPNDPRPCPMSYGEYGPLGTPTLPVLDYLTAHLSRDVDAWARKAKDILEFRTGGVYTPALDPTRVPCVSDEPMGSAEVDRYAAGPRSTKPEDFFWHHALCHLLGAGSTFHFEKGLLGEVPDVGSHQQQCADAVTQAWSLIEPECQTWNYTRGGLADCPLVFDAAQFPEQTSRIYATISGDGRAVAVAVHPNPGWIPSAAPGWRIVSADGIMNSVVHLART